VLSPLLEEPINNAGQYQSYKDQHPDERHPPGVLSRFLLLGGGAVRTFKSPIRDPLVAAGTLDDCHSLNPS